MTNIKKVLAFIYNKERNTFLILKTKGKNVQWFTVTGSVERGETNEEAVAREVKEETGLQVEEVYDLKWGSLYKWQGKECEELNYIVFVKEREIILNEEHDAFVWLPLEHFIKKIKWTTNKKELEGVLELAVRKELNHAWTRIDAPSTKGSLKTKFINSDQVSLLSWHESDDFSRLKNVKQIYGVCFNEKGEMLIIKTKENWSLPGGTPEKGETFEQTLRREVDEEGDIDIERLIPIGYNKIDQIKDRKKETLYQLRYVAKIAKLKKQTIDPATGIIPQRRFIKPEEFLYYCPWGKQGEAMIKKAGEVTRRKFISSKKN